MFLQSVKRRVERSCQTTQFCYSGIFFFFFFLKERETTSFFFLCFVNTACVWSPEEHSSLGFPTPCLFPAVFLLLINLVGMENPAHGTAWQPRSSESPASLFSCCQCISLCWQFEPAVQHAHPRLGHANGSGLRGWCMYKGQPCLKASSSFTTGLGEAYCFDLQAGTGLLLPSVHDAQAQGKQRQRNKTQAL